MCRTEGRGVLEGGILALTWRQHLPPKRDKTPVAWGQPSSFNTPCDWRLLHPQCAGRNPRLRGPRRAWSQDMAYAMYHCFPATLPTRRWAVQTCLFLPKAMVVLEETGHTPSHIHP